MAAYDDAPEEGAARSRWMCHVCNTSASGEGVACSVCFRTTCSAHLRRRLVFNKESGLYEIISICVDCMAEEMFA